MIGDRRLVVLDVAGVRGGRPLTYRAASLQLMLEGGLVAAVLVIAIMGTQLPQYLIVGRVAPGGVLIAVVWVVGIWLLGKAPRDLPWHEDHRAPNSQSDPAAGRVHVASRGLDWSCVREAR